MPHSLENKLVIATTSSALFNTSESDQVFRASGEASYSQHQRERETIPFPKGTAFPFIERLLSVNQPQIGFTPVEVVLLSRNSADSGLRAMNSIAHYELPITRAAFTKGNPPFQYSRSFQAVLYLSTNREDVIAAIKTGLPGGLIMGSYIEHDQTDKELRIAFDFDGLLADDSAERLFRATDLATFQKHEATHASEPLGTGPLQPLLQKIAAIQQAEREKKKADPSYKVRLRTAIVTARSAPAHARPIYTLRAWGIEVDELFFLGGVDKAAVLAEFRPHIFFDDQKAWVESAVGLSAAVHVPFGVVNEKLSQDFASAPTSKQSA